MLCIAKARRIVLQSRSSVHNITSSGHFGHFREQNRTIFRCYRIAIFFFQSRFKLWSNVSKMLNFQNIEILISLHRHFNTLRRRAKKLVQNTNVYK